ncbi:hypothetical protein OQA88_1986 [Cercophora sp. LCS_1]
MGIPWGTIKSLFIFFAPILLPKAWSYWQTMRNAPRAHGLKPRPVPAAAKRSLYFLALVSILFLVRSLPSLSSENVFSLTQSRLQIPTDVLFTRLASLRPNGALTPADLALRARFVNLESRLLYFQFGPDALAGCPFCVADEPASYLYYALPDLVAPHLLNLVIIALVTSQLVSGREAASWRTTATIAGVCVAAFDIYLVSTYKHQMNRRATRLDEIEFFFWDARVWRAVALAGLDAVLAVLIYLSATNKMFVLPPTAAERVEGITRVLGGVKSKLNAAGIIKNTAIRDDDLRQRSMLYWQHEVRLVRDVMEDRDVVEGVNDALQNRIDIQSVSRDAEAYADAVLRPGLHTGGS